MYKDMTLSECKNVDPFIKKCKELKSLEPSLTYTRSEEGCYLTWAALKCMIWEMIDRL